MNWDYIAGFFDGEGNVRVVDSKNSRGISITIAQAESNNGNEVISKIQSFLRSNNINSHIYVYKSLDKRGYKRQPLYVLRISDKYNAKKFLKELEGRVVVKRSDVKDALVFITLMKRHTRPFTDPEKKEIVSLFKNGVKIRDIAKKTGCGTSKVSKFLNSLSNYDELWTEHWLKLGYDKSSISQGLRKEITQLYKSGLTGKEIAEKIGISYHKVRHLLRKEGITRTCGQSQRIIALRKIEPIKEQIIHSYTTDLQPVRKIAEQYGVSEHLVYQFLRSKNLLRQKWEIMAKRTEACKSGETG
jgi:DNA invertase Pin-like site-specific DNA recombinase